MFRFKLALFVLVAVVLVGCIKIPTGDGGSIKLSKDGVTIANEEGNTTDIQYDDKEGQLKITDGEDGEAFNVTVGTNSELPDGFPTEIPIADDATIIQSANMSEGNELYFMITYASKNPIESIKDLYRHYINGSDYVQVDPLHDTNELFEEVDMYHGMIEDEKYFMVSIFEDEDSDGGEIVMVSLTYATTE